MSGDAPSGGNSEFDLQVFLRF